MPETQKFHKKYKFCRMSMTYFDFWGRISPWKYLCIPIRFEPVSAHSVLFQQISLVSNFKVFCKKKELWIYLPVQITLIEYDFNSFL